MSNAKTAVVGVPVSPRGVGDVSAVLADREEGQALVATFVNPHACWVMRQEGGYLDSLRAFDFVACDGIGMILACRLAGLPCIRREAFDLTSLARPVFDWARHNGTGVVLVGGVDGVAAQAAEVLATLFPGLEIPATFSGYGDGPERAKRYCLAKQPGLVVCGMGAPLQERFLLGLVDAGWRGAGFTCGGFLDQTASGGEYFPAWIDRLNLRFLYRLAREPRRLWRRYLVQYQVFTARFACLAWARVTGRYRRPDIR